MSAGTSPDSSSLDFLASPLHYQRKLRYDTREISFSDSSLFAASPIGKTSAYALPKSTPSDGSNLTTPSFNIDDYFQLPKGNKLSRSITEPANGHRYSNSPRKHTEHMNEDLISMILESISGIPLAIEKIHADPQLHAALQQKFGPEHGLLGGLRDGSPTYDQWSADRTDQVEFVNHSHGTEEEEEGSSSGFGSDYEQDLAEAVHNLVMSEEMVSKMERQLSSPIRIVDDTEIMSPQSSVCYGASPGTNSQDGEPVSALWPRQADQFAFTQEEEEDDTSDVGVQDELYSETVGSVCETSSFQEGMDEDDHDFEGLDKVFKMDDVGYESAPLLPLDHRIHREGEAIGEDVEESERDEEEEDDGREYDVFQLRVIREKHRTGFEPSQDWRPHKGSVLGGRYKVQMEIGEAVFSRTYKCLDLETDQVVCLKIIKNTKEYFDQGVDEIRILQCIAEHGDVDKKHLVRLMDYFYFREHLIIVTELLRDNLYEFSRLVKERGHANYFSMPRLKKVATEVLEALTFLHSLDLVHCDLKPENILISDFTECRVKVIDFGSACFVTDELTSYVQSRSYRAPEVILGLPYGPKIDVWSLGCVLAELHAGEVLFKNDSEQSLLERIIGTIGPIPADLLRESKDLMFQFKENPSFTFDASGHGVLAAENSGILSLEDLIQTIDLQFLDFLRSLLRIHPQRRLSAAEALQHPWLHH